MKRTALLVILAVLLSACAAPGLSTTQPATASPADTGASTAPARESLTPAVITPSPSKTIEPILTSDEYPRVDGSTACLPLMALVRSRVTGEDLETAEIMTDCTTTPNAYINLVNGYADLLLVYEPADVTRSEVLDASGIKLNFTPIGRDALVFITHEANKVTGLSTDDLLAIYTGNSVSWSEFGGDDTPITAYQREVSSGSQALFMKLLMKGAEPMQAPTEMYPGGMGELIEAIASYKNDGGAIGFSVYYYAKNMYALPGVKLLEVDGIAPDEKTISSGEYPFVNDFYLVTRLDETRPEVLALRDWIAGEDGKDAVVDAGYVAID